MKEKDENNKKTFISAFAGIGGGDLGFERAGWKCVAQIEIDPKRREVLEQHWPHVPRYINIRECGLFVVPHADCFIGGFPCQDLSYAGKRAGLKGKRSGLFFEFARLLEEFRPPWCVIENVPGLLSSNRGRDFLVLLDTLGQLGYGLAWRVLDSQYFGVPQRRRRVYIVGCLGRPCPPEVLFEPEGGQGDSPKGGKPGKDIAYALTTRAGGGRREREGTYVIGPPPHSDGMREASGIPGRVDVHVRKEQGEVCTCPDTPRYRFLGDAMTVNVMEWIGRRILNYGGEGE